MAKHHTKLCKSIIMKKVLIVKTDERNVLVGGKPVHKDTNDNWVQQLPLTEHEKKEFYAFLQKENMV